MLSLNSIPEVELSEFDSENHRSLKKINEPLSLRKTTRLKIMQNKKIHLNQLLFVSDNTISVIVDYEDLKDKCSIFT